MSLPKSYVSEFRKTHGRSISLAEGPIDETVVSHLAGHKDARLQQILDFLPVRDRVALSRVGPELRSKVIRHEEAFNSRPERSRKFDLKFGMELYKPSSLKYEFVNESVEVSFQSIGPPSRQNLRYDASMMAKSIAFHEFVYAFLDTLRVRFSTFKSRELDRERKLTRTEKNLMIAAMENVGRDGKIYAARTGEIISLRNFITYKNYTFKYSVMYDVEDMISSHI